MLASDRLSFFNVFSTTWPLDAPLGVCDALK